MESSVKRAVAAVNQSRMAKQREQESESFRPSRTSPPEFRTRARSSSSSSSSSSSYNFFIIIIKELNQPCDVDFDFDFNCDFA